MWTLNCQFAVGGLTGIGKVAAPSVFLCLTPETVTWVGFHLPSLTFQTVQLDKTEATCYKCGDLLNRTYCANELTSCKISRNAWCLPGWKLIKIWRLKFKERICCPLCYVNLPFRSQSGN